MIHRLRTFTFCFSCLLLLGTLLPAQTTNTAATNAPAATAPVPFALGEVVIQADQLSARLAGMTSGTDAALSAFDERMPKLVQQINERQQDSDKLLEGSPSLPALRTTTAAWMALQENVASIKAKVSERAAALDAQITELKQKRATWDVTLASAKALSAPPDILLRIKSLITEVDAAARTSSQLRARVLSAQNQISEQEARINAELAAIATAHGAAVNQLFIRDNPPLWETTFLAPAGDQPRQLTDQLAHVRAYALTKQETFGVHAFVFALLLMIFIYFSRATHSRAKGDATWQHAAQITAAPVATAAAVALFCGFWLYPEAPRLFLGMEGAALLFPTVIILRRLIEPALFPILYAMVAAYFMDQWRYVLAASPEFSRYLLVFEMMFGVFFTLWAIRTNPFDSPRTQADPVRRVVAIYAHIALVLFVATGFAEALGYSKLAVLVGNATLESSYTAVIFYAAVRVVEGVLIIVLRSWPLTQLGMVRRHYDLLCANFSLFFRWIAFLCWLLLTLEMFSVLPYLWHGATAVLDYKVAWGSLSLSLGPIVAFGLTIWASFLVSRFLRFMLEEEFYPHMHLAPGIPYAASTMAHYIILVLGFFAAVISLGLDMTNFAILASAFGVGLGFGLQNIMNNFVSGIILLFERPVKVGDVIQLGTDIGTVERIGIRASIIRVDNGSEIIVPNGTLISGNVTNWTLSDQQRVIEIPIAVAAQSDPQKVSALLIAVARAQPAVSKTRAPAVQLMGFTATALNFSLRVWTDRFADWPHLRSDLTIALHTALLKEGITCV